MKYNAPDGLTKLNNVKFNHRLGGAPTPDVDPPLEKAPKPVKELSKVNLDFIKGNHLPSGKIVT